MIGALRLVSMLCALLFIGAVTPAYGLPQSGGDGTGTPAQEAELKCLENTVVSFTADPSTVDLFDKGSTLRWSVKPAQGCAFSQGLRLDGATVGLAGSKTVQPMATETHTLTAPLASGTGTLGTLTISVRLPTVVDIKGSTSDWRALLMQAIGKPDETVHLAPDVDMDLSYFEDVYIAQGVKLLGGLPCGPVATRESAAPSRSAIQTISIGGTSLCGGRDAQHLGPRLYTTTLPNPLFKIRCDGGLSADNVRLSGFRLQGPDQLATPDGDDHLEKAVEINSCLGTEIDHMELSGWAGAAIYVIDDADRQFNPEATLNIHDNFIHLNQHTDHNGYGVDVAAGAWALIEHNVFDFNRHAITAYGTPGDGYRANQNLVLKGGGYNGDVFDETVQIFDVHGDDNCGSPTGSSWNCGNAGTQFWVTNNAFQYTNDWAFKIRGTPTIAAYVDNNVFAHDSVGDAVHSNGSNMELGTGAEANQAGYDSFGKYGVCDLDGDGRDDLFLPTGAGWWYMSGGNRYWTYLNGNTERLKEVGLGDFDGDGRCDVFAVHGDEWVVSNAGTGAWQSLGHFGIPFDQLAFGDFNGDGKTDIFRRAPDGQWSVISPGVYDWMPIQSSSLPLTQLRFGDFNGDRVTDVLAVEGGHWSVSWGGRSSWEPLNAALADDLAGVLIGDLDDDGAADVVRFSADSQAWQVSWGGRGGWQPLVSMRPGDKVWGFMGHFDSPERGGLLALDTNRQGFLYTRSAGALVPYGEYNY